MPRIVFRDRGKCFVFAQNLFERLWCWGPLWPKMKPKHLLLGSSGASCRGPKRNPGICYGAPLGPARNSCQCGVDSSLRHPYPCLASNRSFHYHTHRLPLLVVVLSKRYAAVASHPTAPANAQDHVVAATCEVPCPPVTTILVSLDPKTF